MCVTPKINLPTQNFMYFRSCFFLLLNLFYSFNDTYFLFDHEKWDKKYGKKTLENEISVNIFPFVDENYVMFIVTCKSIFTNSYNDSDKLPKSLIFYLVNSRLISIFLVIIFTLIYRNWTPLKLVEMFEDILT